MGYEKIAPAELEPISRRYAGEFPVTENLIYLNHAGVAPLPRRVARAMTDWVQEAMNWGSYHYDRWLETYEGLRQAAARLIGASRDEIAIVKNTSEGIAAVAMGLDWRPGDRVVVFAEEFPANYLPWKRLERRGVRLVELSIFDPLERVDEACRGARLLALSFVQYLSGYRADVEAIGEICRRRGCLFLLDAIQGLGAFPLDVERARVDVLAADGHKWLLGPEGCGILYVRRAIQEQIEPAEFGWTNVARYQDFGNRDLTLRRDAGRYECGTLNTPGCFGLRAAIELLLEAGIPAIAEAVLALGDQIAEGVRRKGYELACARTPASASGIVSFRKPGVDSSAAVKQLKSRGIVLAARQGWIRASPHFYIGPEDLERALAHLP
ncbi:MAG: aminotransferase class V-fold PLP-dependent enzyme [Bryobacterales bacterium]|nr:aminotransferase class V-fold PLP-dependent enzyme [Bryobacteraceae bacterium]MDW8131265.1 aminotransferase class V-fold PLP-dependent enzyme [Bryobacterales bacterium]